MFNLSKEKALELSSFIANIYHQSQQLSTIVFKDKLLTDIKAFINFDHVTWTVSSNTKNIVNNQITCIGNKLQFTGHNCDN